LFVLLKGFCIYEWAWKSSVVWCLCISTFENQSNAFFALDQWKLRSKTMFQCFDFILFYFDDFYVLNGILITNLLQKKALRKQLNSHPMRFKINFESLHS
jgi:hypothetical protein